ncbi:hypothetical protein R1sor_011054 [Riccia sorocarpa]|uniref:Reverse transcriptase zinc-binding domain-containing protein n=1 Tax=Riccia sorocarpa TaxID=122646 RepID=A0ABD3HZU2_9MARC
MAAMGIHQKYIQAVPVYTLACLDLHKDSMAGIESICRTFLWGNNKEGNPKIPLVAWQTLMGKKKNGGLDLTPFHTLGEAMKLRQISKLFTDSEEEWVQAAEAIIAEVCRTRPRAHDRAKWSLSERLLLEHPKRIPGAPTTEGLLRTWSKVRSCLLINQTSALPKQMQVEAYSELAIKQHWISDSTNKMFKRVWRRWDVKTLDEWSRRARTLRQLGGLDRETTETMEYGWEAIHTRTTPEPLENMEWYWKPKEKADTGWSLPRWRKRLTKIWKTKMPPRDKIWIWKTILQGLPTVERAAKWSHGSNLCARCNRETETVGHMFMSCDRAQTKWNEWHDKCRTANWQLNREGDFIDMLDSAWAAGHLQRILLFVKTTWILWLERNKKTYSGEEVSIPLKVAAKMARETLQAEMSLRPSGTQQESPRSRAIQEIERCFPDTPEEISSSPQDTAPTPSTRNNPATEIATTFSHQRNPNDHREETIDHVPDELWRLNNRRE